MIEHLAWDSDHFGVAIGRVAGSLVSATDVEEADVNGLRCLYLLADAADAAAIQNAEELGFRVTDLRVTLGCEIVDAHSGVRSELVRAGMLSDLDILGPLAATAHVDSRFFADPRLDSAAAADLYVRWLAASVNGDLADLVLVADTDGRAAGYITGRSLGEAVAEIGLFAVSKQARGRGLGSLLLAEYLAAARRQGNSSVSVVTQGSNVGAQRVYQRAGFRTIRTEVWLHRWAPNAK